MSEENPDRAEEQMGDEMDNVVPSYGYRRLPVVGIGGSAGSIPALAAFFQSVPKDTGVAYVVVLHLSPEHESTLAALLQRHTAMPVRQVTSVVAVQRDHVYVIPPRSSLKMTDGHLQLADLPADRPGRVAVDIFFRTLADTHGPHATAIVLSGADGDGAIGIKRIKERGGLTIAQDPDEAQHSGMPRAAIATGMVDWVLPTAEMATRILDYLSLESQLRLPPEELPPAPAVRDFKVDDAGLREVLAFLRSRTGRDFGNYKRATILRRIGRRMQVNGVQTMEDYLGCLRTRPGEAGALLQDLLITVTNFFRDPDCFTALESQLPQIFKDKRSSDTVRAWIVACATGEEAYSIAIMLNEHTRAMDAPPAVQVFATDLDDEAIRVAREGVYPLTISADVSEERLRRYFTKEHRGYRVRREIREMVLFAAHDVLKDSPFSRLDLVSCRNLLIYLNREAQQRVLEIAHFALLPDGRLFLGASETVDDSGPLFSVIDKKHRLYAHRQVPRTTLPVPSGPGSLVLSLEAQAAEARAAVTPGPAFLKLPQRPRGVSGVDSRALSWAELHLRMLEAVSPPSMLVDAEYDIVHLSPHAGRLLHYAGGEPNRNVLRTIHPSLRIELRAGLYQATQSGSRTEIAPIPVEIEGKTLDVAMILRPMDTIAPGMLLLQFETREPGAGDAPPPARRAKEADEPLTQHLDRELERLKSHLRDTVEQYEASTEELKASNEELQAMNEELRSATEELETSREELQSINEELTTVNHELKSKVDELGHANSDMQNLMDATAIATVFLDRELRITRYTPSAVQLFNLIPTDIGRPLSNLSNQLSYPALDADARRVLQGLIPVEREAEDAHGRWYLARLLPYRTIEDRIAGIVLTLVDVTERKSDQEALRLSEERFSAIVNQASVGVVQATPEGTVTLANRFFGRLLGYDEGELIGMTLDQFVHPDNREAARRWLEQFRREGGHLEIEQRCVRKDGTPLWLHKSVSLLAGDRESARTVLVVSTDVTERKLATDALRLSEERLRLIVENAVEFAIFATDLERRVTSWNAGAQRLLGYQEDEILGRSADIVFTEEDRQAGEPQREAEVALRDGRSLDDRLHRRKDGSTFWASGAVMPMKEPGDGVIGFVKVLRDQTSVKATQEELAASRVKLLEALQENEAARAVLENADAAKDRFLAVLSHELRNPLAAISVAAEGLSASPAAETDRAHAVEVVRRQALMMRALLDDLLDISRLQYGAFVLRRRPTTLGPVVESAAESARSALEDRRHRLEVTLPEDLPVLDVDPLRIGQVVSNLLINAAKYTPVGGLVRLWAERSGDQLRLHVADNGKGLEVKHLENIFKLFWRAGSPGDESDTSLGIGLSLARDIARRHGGELRAESDGVGHGSIFTLELPIGDGRPGAATEAAAASSATDIAAPPTTRSAAAQGLRVLIADDNTDAGWALAMLLEGAGHQVRIASGGQEAITLADDFEPQVAVLDLSMPEVDGYAVARHVRSRPWGGATLLIAATGWGEGQRGQDATAAGFDSYLVKPIDVQALRELLAAHGAGRA